MHDVFGICHLLASASCWAHFPVCKFFYLIENHYDLRLGFFAYLFTFNIFHTKYRYRNHYDIRRKDTINLLYLKKNVTRGKTLIFKRVEIYTTNVDFI